MQTKSCDRYNIFKNLYLVLDRLYNVITFTFIRFLYRIIKYYLHDSSIFIISALIISIIYKQAVDETSLAHTIFRILTLLCSQSIMNLNTDHNRLFEVGNRLDVELIIHFTVGTIILVLSAEILSIFQVQSWIKHITTLILFMYAESIQSLIILLQIQDIMLITCVFVYFMIFRYRTFLSTFKGLQNIVQALQMTSINLVLGSLVSYRIDSPYVHIGFLILILLIVDMLASLVSILQESRDYTLWKVSTRLAVIYTDSEVPLAVSSVILILMFIVNSFHLQNTKTIFQVSILTILNHIVDGMTTNAFDVAGPQKAVDSVAYLIIFDAIMNVLK